MRIFLGGPFYGRVLRIVWSLDAVKRPSCFLQPRAENRAVAFRASVRAASNAAVELLQRVRVDCSTESQEEVASGTSLLFCEGLFFNKGVPFALQRGVPHMAPSTLSAYPRGLPLGLQRAIQTQDESEKAKQTCQDPTGFMAPERPLVPPEDGFWGVKRGPSASLEGAWKLWGRLLNLEYSQARTMPTQQSVDCLFGTLLWTSLAS